ncbi:hypothetical protein Z945_2922 [Sulfitobacter noctilucae]|uniref:hypothetical protein n=1 Tax=Sulfitobacter noctilucae TaxID=1342302 RepID=UPI001268FFDC|nr:hypothetical protein [Sulfitobacter noctilucae]KIN75023.1 hypothetical protein Z945_2922 [Sulfitobacter noctilucae]
MQISLTTLLIAVSFTASMAQAGAWLRDKGTGFVSLSFGATQFSETTNAFYLEYGLTEGTTVGLDVSTFTNSENVRNGFGNLFVRRSLGSVDGPHRFAYEVGVGGLWGNEMQLPTVKTSVSWGRGLSVSDRSGWINLDGAFIYEPTLGEHITKFDGTIGMNFTDVTTGLLEVTVSQQNDDTYGAVEPSVLITPRNSSFRFKVGAQIPIEEQDKSALKLGVWHTF